MSDETPTIAPALCPADWERTHVAFDVGGKYEVSDVWLTGDSVRVESNAGAQIDALPGHRHALAALCLHGMPFGFTREDVQSLREWWEFARDLDGHGFQLEAPKIASLMARIAALLPDEHDSLP